MGYYPNRILSHISCSTIFDTQNDKVLSAITVTVTTTVTEVVPPKFRIVYPNANFIKVFRKFCLLFSYTYGIMLYVFLKIAMLYNRFSDNDSIMQYICELSMN